MSKINAFYGANAYRVGEPVNQKPVKIPNKTEVEFVGFSAGILEKGTSGDRVIVRWGGNEYSVLASQVLDD